MYEMSAERAATLFQLIDHAGLDIWIDGGWAVDTLLGEQTRSHEDLDIVVRLSDLPPVLALFASSGIREVGEDDALAWNFLLRDSATTQVDVHSIWFNQTGMPLYGPPDNAVDYPDLTACGVIAGVRVRCTTAESIVAHRRGFQLRQRDYHDVQALCNRFGIERPAVHRAPHRN